MYRGDLMRLLLVEDEKRMAEALAAILRKENYEVDIMNDGTRGFTPLRATCTIL